MNTKTPTIDYANLNNILSPIEFACVLPPVNSFMASASASIDSISKLFVGSSCKRHCMSSLSGFQ